MSPNLRRFLFVGVFVVVALLVAGAVVGMPLFSTVTNSASGSDAGSEPVLTSFSSTGGTCLGAGVVASSSSSEMSSTDAGTVVTYAGNITVPDANYGIDRPTLVHVGDGRYVLDLTESEFTKKPSQNCTARAHYEAHIQIPASAGSVTIELQHDGHVISRSSTGNATDATNPSGTATQV